MNLKLIEEEQSSDGRKGWPCAVHDRIAYPKEKKASEANVTVTFLWTMRDEVLPKLEKKNLALASNFYTPAGLVGMVRNILGNPYIRYIILLGEEYASRAADDQKTELTSANALRAFFEKGIDKDRRIAGFENSVHFDKNILTEMIELVRKNVALIDLNKKMPKASLLEKISEANRLITSLEKKPAFMEKPAVFEYEKTTEAMPYEGGPIIIHGNKIPETWVEVIHNIYRYGRPNLMNANTDRWVKEINNLVAIIHEPQSIDLALNPFLVPMTMEKIEAYKKEVLSPILPAGKAYTYGNKLRAYTCLGQDVKRLRNATEYKDFEFGQGPHVDANVNYIGEICEVDQIADIVEVLKRDPYSKACVAITWHVQDELMRKHKSSPCLAIMQALVQDERLQLMVFFRSHDMVQGWPENAYGCAAIQKFIADGIGIETGLLTIISGSAHVYAHYYAQVEEMLKKHRRLTVDYKDPRGDYTIDVKNKKIIATLVDANNGKELERFESATALECARKITAANNFNAQHAAYLGIELSRAEQSIRNNIAYRQDAEDES
ncbi:MAG: thymidylate synthase [Candidatus Woesearchaeota archaeon]